MVLMFLGLLYIQQHESLIVPIVEYRSAVRGMCCCFTGHGLFNTSCYFYFIDPWFKEETFLFYKEKSEWEKYCKKKKVYEEYTFERMGQSEVSSFWRFEKNFFCLWPPHSTPHVLIFFHVVLSTLSGTLRICYGLQTFFVSPYHQSPKCFPRRKKEIQCRLEVFSW